MIESFYVRFYMVSISISNASSPMSYQQPNFHTRIQVINVGAVAGCIVIPVVARSSIMVAYTIPFVLLLTAVSFFVMGSVRYVHVVPGHGSDETNAQVNSGSAEDQNDKPNFADVAIICSLIVPFNM